MGLKIFMSGINVHTGRLPMAVSSGLNGSQSATKPSAPSTSARLAWSQSAAKPLAPSAAVCFIHAFPMRGSVSGPRRAPDTPDLFSTHELVARPIS